MPEDHYFTLGISQERWLWRYSKLKGSANGWTEFANRKILLHSKLKSRPRLECEIHEGLHALLGPTISEEAVTQTAKDLAKVLWSLGYRLERRDSV